MSRRSSCCRVSYSSTLRHILEPSALLPTLTRRIRILVILITPLSLSIRVVSRTSSTIVLLLLLLRLILLRPTIGHRCCASRDGSTPRRRVVRIPSGLSSDHISAHRFPPIRSSIIVIVLESARPVVYVRVGDSPFPADGLVPRRINRRRERHGRRGLRVLLLLLLLLRLIRHLFLPARIGAPKRLGPPLGYGLLILLLFLLRTKRTRSSRLIPPTRVRSSQRRLPLLGRIRCVDSLLCTRTTIARGRSAARAGFR